MEGTLALVLVLTFLVGGLTLALAMGYRDIEESRERREVRPPVAPRIAAADMVPSFFAKAEPRNFPGSIPAFDEALLMRLEQHVRAEHATVAQFVHYPSVDSLYRQSGSSLHVH